MNKYSYEHVITDPRTDIVESLVGQLVYFGDSPAETLFYANTDNSRALSRLRDVKFDQFSPFIDSVGRAWSCIIQRTGVTDPVYTPFSSTEDFLYGYKYNQKKRHSSSLLDRYGMWLINKNSGYTHQVNAIAGQDGVYISTYEYYFSWNMLLDEFLFLDGTPCGVLIGEDARDTDQKINQSRVED